MRNSVLTVSALVAAFAAAPAAAQSAPGTYYAGGAPFETRIPVTASIGGRCQFSPGKAPTGSFNQPDIDTTTWSHEFPFEIDCNTISKVAVVSSNGGLLSSATAGAGYTALAPYSVKLDLAANAGISASQSCTAASLKTGASSPCGFGGTASAGAGLLLLAPSQGQTGSKITVAAPAYNSTSPANALVAGTDYTDTLIITIASAI